MSSDSRRFRQVFRPSPKVSGQSRGRRRARVPRLELLEDRTLLSITTKVNGNQIAFTGDGQADHLSLRVDPNKIIEYSTDDGQTFQQTSPPVALSANPSISVDLETGAGVLAIDPTFTAAHVPLAYTASASASLHSLAGPSDAPDTWNVIGKDSGTLDGVISFSKLGQVFGGDNTSTFTIQPFSGGGNLSLTGGSGSNTLDYSAFSKAANVNLATGTATNLGFVTGIENVTGGRGDNTITGDDQNNILTGGPGNNTLSGGSGNDTFVLKGTWGTDVVSENTGSNGGTGKLDFSAVASNLKVAVNADDSLTITSSAGTVKATGISQLVGGTGSNTLDYSAYGQGVYVDLSRGLANDFTSISGIENLTGSMYPSTLIGDGQANILQGLSGKDTFTGGGGNDTIEGGPGGNNWLVESQDASFTLTNTQLKVTPYGSSVSSVESLSNIQHASLTGGVHSTTIDASGFTKGGVKIDGGATVPLAVLNGGIGVRTHDPDRVTFSMTGSTPLSSLNNGDGVGILGGGQADFQVVLTDGRPFNVTLTGAQTIQDVIDDITTTGNTVWPGRIKAFIDTAAAESLVLQDLQPGSGQLRVIPLNNSTAADDLGLPSIGPGAILHGSPITNVSEDLLAILTDGTRVGIDLSGLTTLQEVIDAFHAADPRLIATINAGGTGIDLHDSAGGSGNLKVIARNGSMAAQDLGLLGTGTGAVLHGTSIVTGTIRLDGRLKADKLIGSPGDDTITSGGGNDTIRGGGGFDTLAETGDANMTLTHTQFTMGNAGTSTLSGISKAILTGGPSGDKIDASGFRGPAVLTGGTGNDTILGGSGNDTITGGGGVDTIDGGGGANTLVETNEGRFVIQGTTASATLDMGQGTDQVDQVALTGTVTAGNFRLGYGTYVTTDIPYDAPPQVIKSALSALPNLGPDDVMVDQADVGAPWTITFVGDMAGKPALTLTAINVDLAGGNVTASVLTPGTHVFDTLKNIQQAVFTSGPSSITMDASGWSGDVTMYGGAGDDTLIAGSGNADIEGGSGNNVITAGTGTDTLIGGSGQNTLIASLDANFTLTDTGLTVAGKGSSSGVQVADTISGFQFAQLTGGPDTTRIDASGFTGVSTATQLGDLNGGNGVRTTSGTTVDLHWSEAITKLSTLDNGAGVHTLPGNDLKITLSDGSVVNVALSGATTVRDVENLITLAGNGRLTVGLDSAGTALVLTDSQTAGGNLQVQSGNGSTAAADLGLLGTGAGNTLTGRPISDGSADIRISLTDGSIVGVDLSSLITIQDVLDAINQASPKLNAILVNGSIQITDSAHGSGPLSVANWNGSFAATDLGIVGSAPSNHPNRLSGQPLGIGSVAINGNGGNAVLIGSPGNDTISGGGGNATIQGGGGTDTLVESGNVDFTLTNTSLTYGTHTDTLAGISRAILTGGSSANKIDASAFTLGPVTLTSGGGLDTLLGGTAGDNQFIINVAGLTPPTSATDTAHQVSVDTGNGTGNSVTIHGFASGNVTQADLNWVHYLNAANQDFTFNEVFDQATLESDLLTQGGNVQITANSLDLNGHTIDTSAPTRAGNITLTAQTITIDNGAKLIALATTRGGTNGTITIDGAFTHGIVTGVPGAGNAKINVDKVNVTIGDATIEGGNVAILATASSASIVTPSDFGNIPGLSTVLGVGTNTILQALAGLSFEAQVAYSESDAIISIGTTATDPATTIVADNFTAWSQAVASPSASPTSLALIGAAAAVAKTDAEVTLNHVNVTTASDAIIRATTNNAVAANGSGTTTSGYNFGVAVTVTDYKALADVTKDTTLTVGHDLFVQADTTNQNYTGANSQCDPSGKLGLAIAVSVTNGNSDAYLDGTAHVANNVSVTGEMTLAARSQTVPPEFQFGVSAGAGIESNSSTGDLLQDTKSSTTGLIKGKVLTKFPAITQAINWVKGKLGVDPSNSATGTRSDFQAAAAIAFVEEANHAVARIGDGNTSDPTDQALVNAGGTITVNGSVSDSPALDASATAQTDNKKAQSPDKSKTFTGTADVGVTLAVDVGNYVNDAEAHISGNAVVNAGGALTVEASPQNQFDPTNTWGSNLKTFGDPSTYKAKYDTSSGPQVLHQGDTVQVPSSYDQTKGGGHSPYEVYTYIGPDNNTIDLGTEDYTNSLLWQGSSGVAAGALGFLNNFRYLTGYLNSNLGLDNFLFNNATQSVATGQVKASVAGSVAVLILNMTGDARIESGAQVNQDTSFRTNNHTQSVTVQATGENDMINFGGNLQTPGLSNLGITSSTSFRSWSLSNPKTAIKGFTPLGVGGPDTSAAIGATVNVYHFISDIEAQIEDGVKLYADGLGVVAHTGILNVTIAGSGGKSEDFSFNGVVVYAGVNNTTIARVGSQSTINVGNTGAVDDSGNDLGSSTVIQATDSTTVVSVAGALAISEKAGIGGSAAVNVTNRDTEAALGDLASNTSPQPGGQITIGGGLQINASNSGFLGSFAVAGATASNTQEREGEVQTTAGAGAVAFAYNAVSGSTKAYIDNATVTAGSIAATATFEPIVETFSIGGSYASGGKNSIALAGAAAVNLADQDVGAFIQDSSGARSITAVDGVTLTATDQAEIFAQAGAVAIAWGSGSAEEGANSLSIGASVALNLVGTQSGLTVKSFIDDATVTNSGSGNVTLNATSTADEEVLAIGGALSKASNGSMSFNGSAAGAAAGAYAENSIAKTVQATIQDSSSVTTGAGSGGSVELTATDSTKLIRTDAFGVALAYASAANLISSADGVAAGIGVGVAINQITDTVHAGVEASTVTSDQDVMILASSAPVVAALAIGVAATLARGTGLTGSLALAGAGTANTINEDDEAYIRNGAAPQGVTSRRGSITVNATDGSSITANAGGVGIALASSAAGTAIGATIGVSAATNDVENHVLAYVDGSTATASNGSVTIESSETANIQALTIGGAVAVGAGGGSIGVGIGAAGAGSGNTIKDHVEAYAQDGAGLSAPEGQITLSATDSPTIVANAGGVGIGVGVSDEGVGAGAALGVSAAVNDVEDYDLAYADSAALTAFLGISLTATETANIQALTIGGAVGVGVSDEAGVGVAAAGAGSENTIKNQVEAYARDGASLTATQGNVALGATDTSTITANAGGVGIAVGAGGQAGVGVTVGISAASNDVENRVLAYAQGSYVASSGGQVTVSASETATIKALTIGGAIAVGASGGGVGVGVGGAGAGSGNTIKDYVEAYAQDGATVSGYGGVGLSATDNPTIIANGGGVGIAVGASGGTGVGVSLGVGYASNKITDTVLAYVDIAVVTAASGSVSATATETANISGLTIGGAIAAGGGSTVGVGAAIAGSTTTDTVNDDVEAYIHNSKGTYGVTAKDGGVSLSATDSTTITTSGGGVSIGVGIGGTVGVAGAVGFATVTNNMNNTVLADIDDSNVTATGRNVALSATETANINAVGVGGAVSVAGGASAAAAGGNTTNTLNNTVKAYLADGAAVTTTTNGNVTLSAMDTPTVSAETVGAAVAVAASAAGAGALSIGAAVANNTITDTVHATSDASTINSVGAIKLTAQAQPGATAESIAASVSAAISLTSFAFSGGGASSTNTIDNDVQSDIQGFSAASPSTITAGGAVSISASETGSINATVGSGALTFGLVGASVGVSLSSNTIDSTILAEIDNAHVSGGSIQVAAAATDSVQPTTTVVTSVAIALGGAGAGGDASATVSPTVQAVIGGGAILQTPGDLSITSSSTGTPAAQITGVAAGLVAVGACTAEATVAGETLSMVDAGASLTAGGNLSVTATGGALGTTQIVVASAAIVGARVNSATTTITPTIDAHIGENDTVNVTGNVTVAATSSLAEGHADAKSYGGAAVNIGAGVSKVTTSPVVKGYIDAGAQVQAGGAISVNATGADQTSPPVDPTGAFNPSTSVDTQNGTIRFPVSLADGAEVQYQADPTTNTPIGGLNSDQIQLTVAFKPGSGGDQILLYGGQVWTTYGFVPGMQFTLTDPSDKTDNGTFTVASVYLNVLTVTASNALDSATNQAATLNLSRVYRILNPSLTASGLDFVNGASGNGNSITRTGGSWVTDGFVAGEQITISGSNNQGTYTVQGVTDSTLTLVNVNNAPWAEAGTLTNFITITSQGAFRFGETFDASQVNTANDTITFTQPHDLQTGDAIRIDTQGNPVVGGLDPSQTYYVRKVDDYTIQLTTTPGLATPDEVSPSEYRSSDSTFDLPELGINQSSPIPVTYHAPTPTTFYAPDVNVTYDDKGNKSADADTIYVPGTNFTEGETVTFSFTGQVSPLVGLTQGEEFEVHIASTDTKSGTSNIQLYAVDDPQKTPITLTTVPSAAGATMSLVRLGFGPLVAQENGQSFTLVDGNTYLAVPAPTPTDLYAYQIEDPATGAILTNFNTDPSVWDPEAVHTFTGGVLAITPSTGTQSIYIALSSAPDQTDHLTAAGGASLSTLAPPAGTGVSTATTEGGGAGSLQFAFPSATLTAKPVVWAYSAAAHLTAGGDVTIGAASASNVNATITNGGGGVLAVGQVTATVIQQPDTEAFVGRPEIVNGVNSPYAAFTTISAANFKLTSSSDLTSYVSAESVGGGAIGGAIAHTSDQVSESTFAQVGFGADITATGAVTIAADAQKSAHTNAYTYFVAVGGGANSDQQDFGSNSPSGVNVGTMTPSKAAVNIGDFATLSGQTVSLKATESKSLLESDASATAYSPILLGVDVALARANVHDGATTEVTIGYDASITGTQGVDVLSIFTPAQVTAHPYALAVALIPVPDGKPNTSDTTQGTIVASTGAKVTAGARSASGPLEQVAHDTSGHAVHNVALNVQAYEVNQKGGTSGGIIHWSADVDILGGGAPSADTLTIDKDGGVTQNNGFSVQNPGDGRYFVSPVSTPGNSIYFYGEWKADQPVAVPTFTFAPSVVPSITIHNSSDITLLVGPIDVTALGVRPEVYLDSPNQGIVNKQSAFNFGIATSEAQPTLVDIEDDNPSQPYLILEGINNPIGQTIIKNVSGNVTNLDSSIRTNLLDIVAGGDVGYVGGSFPSSVEMVQYRDDSGHVHRPSLNVSAGRDIALDVRGRQRDGSSDPVTIHSEGIVAGGSILIDEEQGLADGPATGTRGGVVVAATQQGQSGTYNSYYYSSNGGTTAPPTAIDNGLFGDMNHTSDVVTDYDFDGRDANFNIVNIDGITAVGDVKIVPSPTSTSPTINVGATLDLKGSTDTVSVTANGWISLWETDGALRVGKIISTTAPGGVPGVMLWSEGVPFGAGTGHDIVLGPGAVIGSNGDVELDVQDDFTMDSHAGINSSTKVTLNTDFLQDFLQFASQAGPGSTVDIAGAIKSPIENILQVDLGAVPRNDTISLTNVQKGTVATITMQPAPSGQAGFGNTINLGSLNPFDGGQLSASTAAGAPPVGIAGAITVQGSGLDTLNLDDSGDKTTWTGSQEPTLTATNLTGLGMGTPTGVAYSGLKALNLKLGSQPQTIDVHSTAAGTTSTIITQATGNTWDVGSLAPTTTGGVLDGLAGALILDGGGTGAALTDTLTFDDSGSTTPGKSGLLTEKSLSGNGLGYYTEFHGIKVLDVKLGSGGTALTGRIGTNLPPQTTIEGEASGPNSYPDSFSGTWLNDFNGSLRLLALGYKSVDVDGQFRGSLDVESPAELQRLTVGGSVNVGSSIDVQQIDTLSIRQDLDINLTLPGLTGAPAGSFALGDGRIGRLLPEGVTLTAASINSLEIGDQAGQVDVNAGDLVKLAVDRSIEQTAQVNVTRGNLDTLLVGTSAQPGEMAGTIDVKDELVKAAVLGGTPGLFIAGQVGTISADRAFGPIDLRVIEAGVQRWLEEDPSGQVFSQPGADEPNGVFTKYLYESAGFSSPQLAAQINNHNGDAPDQFDLSTIVFQDGAKFNVDLVGVSPMSDGVSGLRNIAVEGDLLNTLSSTAINYFGLPSNATGGIDLPMDRPASVSVRDHAPAGSILASAIQAVAFGSFTNGAGQVEPGSQSTAADATGLLAAGTTIVPAGSVNGQGTETFRVPFAALPGQKVAFYLDTAPSGGALDPNNMEFTLESDSDGVHAPTLFPATRGAVTAMIGVSQEPTGSVVQSVDLHGDGGSIFSEQFIAQSITSTGPLGDLTVLAPQGLNNVTAPRIFGNIAAQGPLFGTIQTTGVRTDPVTGDTSQIPADLGRAYVVPAGGRNRGASYVTTTTIEGQGQDSLSSTGRIISRGNLISFVRSDGGAKGLIAVQGDLGAVTTLLGTPTRVGGLLVNGGFDGQLVVLGNDYGDLTFHGGITGGRIAVQGTGGTQSGILGNVILDRGIYKTGMIGAGSAIVSGGEIGDASYGTSVTVEDGNQGIVAAIGAINFGNGPLGGSVFNDVGATPGNPNAAAIDAIFTDNGQPLGLDLPGQPLGGLELILQDLVALAVDSTGNLTGPKR